MNPMLKRLGRQLAVAFPGLANAVWKIVYPSVSHAGEMSPMGKMSSSDNDEAARDVEDLGGGEGRLQIFLEIFQKNLWENHESVSGIGSTLHNTTSIRKLLPGLLAKYYVRSLLDAPCGDFNWMPHVTLPPDLAYLGCDIVPELIDGLIARHATRSRSFEVLDIVEGPIPDADFWLCRDVLFHLPSEDALRVLQNAAESNVRYFASTTYDLVKKNRPIRMGRFQDINLQKAPYCLPRPLEKIDDFLAPNPPRQLGIWSRTQLRQRFSLK